jgi:hypothetical protein
MIRARFAWLPVLPFALGGAVLTLSACTVAGPTVLSQPPGTPPSLTVHRGTGNPAPAVINRPAPSQSPGSPPPVTGSQGAGGPTPAVTDPPANSRSPGGSPSPTGSPTAPVTVTVDDGAGRHTVTVTVGERLAVILGSTYWNVAGSSRPAVLSQDGATAVMARPASCPATPPGLGCVPVETDFSALTPGTAVVTATRVSCGEALACAPSQRNFTLTVTVRARP